MAKTKLCGECPSMIGNVTFRYLQMSDLDDLLRNINSLVRDKAYLSVQTRQTKAQSREFIRGLLRKIREGNAVAVVAQVRGKVVGLCDISRKTTQHQTHVGSLGVALVRRAQGHGIGTELIRVALYEAELMLGLSIVELTVAGPNIRAWTLYGKLGFERIGILRGGICHYGKYVDQIRMANYLS